MLKLAALLFCSLSLAFGHQGPEDDFHFYCAGKTVGNYENPADACSGTFYSCVADGYPAMGIERVCPKDLFFNEDLNRCVEKEYVPACLEEEPEETEFERYIRINNNIVQTCIDGKYEHPDKPCSAEYVVCDDGHISIKECPFPEFLRFDVEAERCLEEQYVRACQEDSEEPERTLNAEDVTCTRPGTYFVENPLLACSTEYITCVDKVAYELSCPENLYFDILSGECVNAQLCPACRGHLHVDGYHAPSHGHYHGHRSYGHKAAVFVKDGHKYGHKHGHSIVPVAKHYFAHKPAAKFDFDNEYYQFTHPELQHEQEDFDARFPHRHPSQDHEHSIPRRPVVTPLTNEDFPTAVYGHKHHDHYLGHRAHFNGRYHHEDKEHHFGYYDHHHHHEEPFVCWTKPDGSYESDDCSSLYYVCDHGILSHEHCRYGHVFSDEAGECVHRSDCAGCVQPDPYCEDRDDGIYKIDCNSYFVCDNHKSEVNTCPHGEAFDEDKECCVPLSECPAPCGYFVVVKPVHKHYNHHRESVHYNHHPRAHVIPGIIW